MTQTFVIAETFPVNPEILFTAWMDSDEHGAFIDSNAEIDPEVNGKFTIWDGYIHGTNLELIPYSRIVQSWRTTDFPDGAPDSVLELTFEPKGTGTHLTLRHSKIPDGQADEYLKGWKEFYFKPMKDYFSEFNH